jgi:Flp pilus assembly protein TadG
MNPSSLTFLFASLRLSLRRFTGAIGASTAITFALLLLPLMLVAGGTIDILTASRVKDSLQAAADAAALNAISITKSTPAFTEDDMRSVANANLRPADQARLKSFTSSIDRQWERNIVVAEVTVTGEVETSFLSLMGLKSITVGASSTAKSGIERFLDLYIVLDNSDSMGLAATPDERTRLIEASAIEKANGNLTFEGRGCQFACHNGLMSTDQTSVYRIARANQVLLRFDVAKAGVEDLLDLAEAGSGGLASTRFGLSTFNNAVTTLVHPTTRLDAVRTALQTIEIGSNTGPTSNRANTRADLAFEPFGAYVAGRSNQDLLDGRTVSYDRVVFLVTDGVKSTINAGTTSMPFETAWCNELKTNGTRLAVLYTTYLADFGNSQFDRTVAPFYDRIRPALQACASPGLFAEGDDPDQIRAAFKSLFEAAKLATYISG